MKTLLRQLAVVAVGVLALTVLLTRPAARGAAPGLFSERLTHSQSIAHWQADAATHLEGGGDALLSGDSGGLVGLLPELFQRETGLSAWNLSTLGYLRIVGHQWLVEAYRARHPGTRLLVYQIDLRTTTEPAGNALHLPYRAALERTLGREEPAVLDVPWLTERTWSAADLRSQIIRPRPEETWRDRPYKGWPSDREIEALLRAQRGQLDFPTAARRKLPGRVEPPKRLRTRLDAGAAHELQALFDYARATDLRVLLAFNPLPEAFESAENAAGAEALTTQIAALEGEAGSGVTHVAVYPGARFYPAEMFGNVNHLERTGAERNTRELARHLRGLGWAR